MSESLPGFLQIPGGAQIPAANDDGRNVDLQTGALSGEGAGQKPPGSRQDVGLQSQIFPHVPSHQPCETPTYYGTPVLKQPVWHWPIAAYFYVGGVAGMSATLGSATQLFGGREMRSVVIKTRWIATTGALVSTGILVQDLGRPERFLNMLRVFKLTSPMSMGSWILSAFSSAAAAATVLPYGPRVFRSLAGIFGAIAGLLGLPLAAYTGVLIVQTAVPVWKNPLWSVLALCSSTAAAGSLLELLPLNAKESRTVEVFSLAGKIGEIVTANAIEKDAARIDRVARPFHRGFSGLLWQSAKVLLVSSAVIAIAPGRSPKKRIAAGLVGTAASVCMRFAYFLAGKRSARDPRATFEQQRQTPAITAGQI
ncbi:MAG TPA: NrfD/PsrC family molybdoenzyme membrane anchor subunit [Bryobacteraceae bacterium]|nr:NrfD/PsrC family molybdoenzyme membrane anchor subunit [Bryobacteraceae bacterium]